MFSSKSKETPMEQTTKTTTSTSASIIAAGTEITGNIICDGDIRIDGVLNGNVNTAAKVILGPEGTVNGDIEAKQADVMGKVKGKIIIADILNLKGKALIDGDIYTGQLQVEPTASFNGSCHMGAAAAPAVKNNFLRTEAVKQTETNKETENVLS
ncbi:MAG: bactofilin family protein [Sphingobacteriales bacterium]